ncbi:PhoD-like phosphatase N-terminal domain-containing protein [Pseudoalteromonas phenolica]|jgi:phosphodiesterase/alkaline phosphatase D-like protein|uniref:PhoD-like phosphatase N-terminal domain-containing protein n=1 Tax=Pseudoalteromonas phenolica TaxID=161398 RepID=UPI003850D3D7
MVKLSRRSFIIASAAALASSSLQAQTGVTSIGVIDSSELDLNDVPTASPDGKVTIKLRVEPFASSQFSKVKWEISQDEQFSGIVNSDVVTRPNKSAYTLEVNLHNVPPGSVLYYRFSYENCNVHALADMTQDELTDNVLSYDVFPTQEIKTNLMTYRNKHSKLIHA